MSLSILVLNGPNLDQLGTREPEVYGTATLADIMSALVEYGSSRDVAVQHFQSAIEGVLVDQIHKAAAASPAVDGIVLNAGAFSHYSYALRDAIAGVRLPVVEAHLSNPAAREEFRHTSVIAPVCAGTVTGFGANSYRLALDGLILRLGGSP